MSSLNELMEAGSRLGYQGKELQDFVRQQQAEERENRRLERQLELERVQATNEQKEKDRQAELERAQKELEKVQAINEQREKDRLAELERMQAINEQKERDRQLELERIAAKERDRQLELEKMQAEQKAELEKIEYQVRLEKELAREKFELERRKAEEDHKYATDLKAASAPVQTKIKGHKLPFFDEDKDNIDSYLLRFERYADLQGWKRDEWSVHLSALLKGKALDIYSRLPVTDALEYDKLKEALLHRFEMTEEGFRKRFRSGKPERGETFVQYVSRARNYLQRWLQLAKVGNTYDDLIDFLLRDQLMGTCNRDLYLFLKEKRLVTVKEVATIADQYAEARGGVNLVIRRDNQFQGNSQVRKGQSGQHNAKSSYGRNEHLGQKGASTASSNVSNKGSGRQVQCFKCGGNHYANECRNRGSTHKAAAMQEGQVGDPGAHQTQNKRTWHNKDNRNKGKGQAKGDEASSCVVVDTVDQDVVERVGSDVMVGTCLSKGSNLPLAPGRVNGTVVTVMRDTGCTGVVVRRSLVNEDQLVGRSSDCKLLNGQIVSLPRAKIEVESPFYTGVVEANCMDDPMYDLTIGNIEGSILPTTEHFMTQEVNAVETRGQKRLQESGPKKLKVAEVGKIASREEFVREQASDQTLAGCKNRVGQDWCKTRGGNGKVRFEKRGNLFYRVYVSARGQEFKQVLVPEKFREKVIQVAHDSIMGGHLGMNKTVDRVLTEFYWPSVNGDVRRFCRSCDVCQRTVQKGRIPKVPLKTMPIIEVPFKRVAVDIVGPIFPATDRKNRYILTMVDYATRYPEAIALPSIDTERVAEALVEMFSRLGIPEEMLTDCGTQFTSELMGEISRLLSLRQLTTSPYHPMCNGLVEKFNGTLKQMLKRMCNERPSDWDRYLNALLFAYREVPQESLGFSPFELLYGRTVRGPIRILKEIWTDETSSDEVKSTYQYVIDLKEKLEETCKIAQSQLQKASTKYKRYYDKKAKVRKFKIGDKVLVLRPTNQNKLLLQWKGPFEIREFVGLDDYRVEIGGKVKTYHANLLKKYVERNEIVQQKDSVGLLTLVNTAVIEEGEVVDSDSTVDFDCPSSGSKESVKDVRVSEDLSSVQDQEIRDLLHEFEDVMTDKPGRTNLIEHDIKLTTTEPFRVKGYPIPFHSQKVVDDEIQKMLDLDVIETSDGPFASPIVIIKKRDQTVRFCIDMRQLNKRTVFDAEPMPNIEQMFAKLSGCKYFSKLDLSKGYWQVPLTERAKELTGFVTTNGNFRFKVMPFGLVNAPATFCRLMRKVLRDLSNTDSFVDDILVYTETWEEHLVTLRKLMLRLRDANLTARPTKCSLGYKEIDCLGFTIGESSHIFPQQEKVESVRNAPRPTTKKQVRSFLGLTGFYRKFVPNFAAIAAPLSDLTKKGQPNKLIWEESQERAFRSLKESLVKGPILRLPDLEKPFVLRTDASDVGLGAVLLQYHDGTPFPIMYASRKLSPAEQNYAVIEKECLAVVWGVGKFYRYLFGRDFTLETDHQPLAYMSKAKVANSRIMRWALSLQPFRMTIRAIRGCDNVGADYLSRQ